MDSSARLYLCERCRAQVIICSTCDRGQIYCGGVCSAETRRTSRQAAGRRYQSSRQGRFTHAGRQRRYRARQQKVTHQGSPPPVSDAVLPAGLVVTVLECSLTEKRRSAPGFPGRTVEAAPHCHVCGRPCPPFFRWEFLRIRQSRRCAP